MGINCEEIINDNSKIGTENNTNNPQNENSNKQIIFNILFVAISNIITLLSGILVGLILPKIMSKQDYGLYKTFTLYFSYIGLFPLGFIDGIYLLYAGVKYNDINKEKFRLYTRFLSVFQLILSIIVVILSIPFLDNEFGVIFLCIGINIVFNSLTGYFQIISQITGRFKELSIRNIIKATLTSISIIVLTILYYINLIPLVNYLIYIIIFTIISIVLTIWYIITYRDIVFFKATSLNSEAKEIFNLFRIGLPLLIANLVSSFILTIDRQFVSVLFDIETYASYAFAYNLLSLITTVISAISTVLYPTIKTYDEKTLFLNYNKLISIISLVVGLSICVFFPLKFIIEKWLNNYIDSLLIFRVILPGLVLSSCISIIMFNYYKALKLQTKYFCICLFTLFVSFIANTVVYLIFKNTISISIASVFVMFFWYFLTEFFIIKKIHVNSFKNCVFIFIEICLFYLVTFFIENVFIGLFAYLTIFVAISLLFHFKLICKFFSHK